MWDLSGPSIEPVSPALAGGYLATEPPGKPGRQTLNYWTTREVWEAVLRQEYLYFTILLFPASSEALMISLFSKDFYNYAFCPGFYSGYPWVSE